MGERWFQNGSARGNVVFNFLHDPSSEFGVFAEGYHDAGQKLVREWRETPVNDDDVFLSADYHGYPILFLYRHALELSLKAVVFQGAIALRLGQQNNIDTTRLFRDHRLMIWVRPVATIVRSVGWRFEHSEIGSFEHFERLVRGIEEIDPLSYNFRYPVNKDGDGALPHHSVVNVLELAHQLDVLIPLLLGAADGLNDCSDQLAEAEDELRRAFEVD